MLCSTAQFWPMLPLTFDTSFGPWPVARLALQLLVVAAVIVQPFRPRDLHERQLGLHTKAKGVVCVCVDVAW